MLYKNKTTKVLFLIGLIAGLLLFVNSVEAAAGINKQLRYQGRLTDSNGNNVTDGNYNFKISIYDAVSGGNLLWTWLDDDSDPNTYTGTPQAVSVAVADGIFNVVLGDTTDNKSIMGLNFNSDSYYFSVTVGADAEMAPRLRIGAAGYAFNADTLDGSDWAAPAAIGSGSPAAGTFLDLTASGTLNFPDNSVAWADVNKTGSSLADLATKSAAALTSGNLDIARMPTGGSWSLSSDLNIDSNLLVASQDNDRIGIGTSTPQDTLDLRGDLLIPAADSHVDCDGSTTSGAGTCDSISDGTTLVAMAADKLDFDNNNSADGQVLCTNSLTAPTIVAKDNDNDCANGAGGTAILGTPNGTETNAVSSEWAFKDDDSDSLLDDGEDLYIDRAPATRYFSSGGTNFIFDSINGIVGIGTTTPNPLAKLEVAGDVLLNSDSPSLAIRASAVDGEPEIALLDAAYDSLGYFDFNYTDSKIEVGADAGYALSLQSNGSEQIYLDTTNKVGIGTNSPAANLEIGVGAEDAMTGLLVDQSDLDQIAAQIATSANATATMFDFDTRNISGEIINLDWNGAIQATGNITGLDLDFTNLTPVNNAANTLYGLTINNPAANNSSTAYGLYVLGTNWDYGIYSADNVYIGANLTVTGITLATDKIAFTQTDNNEYIDSLTDAYMDYGATTGHRFLIGGTEQINLTDGILAGTTDNDIDLGSATKEFKDLYIDGTANIDSLVADTADINAGTIDATTIGASSASTGVFTRLSATTSAYTAANGNNNNVVFGDVSFVKITGPTAAFAITGIAGGVDGRILIIANGTVQNMTIANVNANSSAANQIYTSTGANQATAGLGFAILIYQGVDNIWLLLSLAP